MPDPFVADKLAAAWQTGLSPAICEQCDWRYLLPEGSLPRPCPHCFQAQLVPLTEFDEALPYDRPPELVIPFSVSEATIGNYIIGFASGITFAPRDLTIATLQKRLRRVYLPLWLVDADIRATWQAEVGFDYDVVSHRASFAEQRGGWQSQQVTETRIRWEPRVGRLTRHYDNVSAPALEGHAALQRRLGPYDVADARPYQTDFIAQAAVHLPDRPPSDAWPEAEAKFMAWASAECEQACQGQHFREFRWQANYHNPHWTLLLLPVYTTYYLDDEERPYPLLIHGQTGRLSGRRQASMRRARRTTLTIAAVALALFIVSLLLAGASLLAEQLFIVAVCGVLLSILVGVLSLIPLGMVWQFNRTN